MSKKIVEFYREQGYMVARAYLPQQEISFNRGAVPDFKINDAGPGLDQATIDQLRRSPQDASGNVGTGLRLARVFADMYGGRLDIDSSPGQGCHVSVLLPVKRQAAGREVSP